MFTLLRSLSAKQIFAEQVPAMGAAWIVAELFYKFHSFTLECAAFLVTWFAFDAAISGVKRLIRGTDEQANQT